MAGIMLNLGSVQSAWRTSLLFGAGIGVPLLLRWVWHRQNAYGELFSMGASLVMAPLLLAYMADARFAVWGYDANAADATRLIVMATVSTTAAVVGSLWTRPVPMDNLCRFYERVRPPGFWGPIAAACGDDPADKRRELGRGLGATFAAAGSVFAYIVGFGTWVVHAPGPSWIGRGVWIAANLVVGTGLVAVWWRLARLGDPEPEPGEPSSVADADSSPSDDPPHAGPS